MILNVLRVEQLSVEEIMKRSFAEFSHQKDAPEFKTKRKALKKQINEQPKLECQICAKDLEKYYGDWKTFHDLNFQLKVCMKALPRKFVSLCVCVFHTYQCVLY